MATFRVRLTGLLMGQLHENQFYLQETGGGLGDAMACAVEVRDGWCPVWRDMFSISEFAWTNIRVADIEAPNSAPANLPVNIAGSGLSLTPGVTFAAYSVRKLTAQSGRTGRGRMYIGRLSSANLGANGLITNAALASLNVRAANCMARYGPAGSTNYRLVLVREKPPQTIRLVTQLFFDNVPRCQRRRNIGIGA